MRSVRSMRPGLPLDLPANPNEGGRPTAHAAWNVTLRNSAGASRCSRRSAITRRASACTRATASSRSWPYAMVPDRAGTSASQRPSSSRSISIVNVTRAMYHSGRLSNKAMDADAGRLLAHPARRGSSQGVSRIRSGSFSPVAGVTAGVSKSDDIAVVGAAAVNDQVRESADGELTYSRSASPRRANFRVSFDQVESAGDGVEEPGTPSRPAFFVPPHCLSEFP